MEDAIRVWVHNALKNEGEDNLFDTCMDGFASLLIKEALNMTGGNGSKAARLLGLSRPTLHSKIEKFRLKFETSVKGI